MEREGSKELCGSIRACACKAKQTKVRVVSRGKTLIFDLFMCVWRNMVEGMMVRVWLSMG